MARLLSARTLFIGLAAAAAYKLRNKQEQVTELAGQVKDTALQAKDSAQSATASPSVPEPAPAPAEAPDGVAANEPGPAPAPPVANLDVAGPPLNTATHVPAPEPQVHEPEGGIDEAAEEAAAAAEAANIGGTPSDYPDPEDPSLEADEAMRPLEEAGEGYNEGQELAESDLIENTEPAAGDPIEGGRAIDDVIELQDEPLSGERGEALEQMGLATEDEPEQEARDLGEPEAEALPELAPDPDDEVVIDAPPPPTGAPAADVPPPPSAEDKSSAVWRIENQPTVEAPKVRENEDPRPTRSESEDGS